MTPIPPDIADMLADLRTQLTAALAFLTGVVPTDAEIVTAVKDLDRRCDNAEMKLAEAHAALDAMPASSAPECDTPAQRIRYATSAWRDEREEASNLATLCQDAHHALDAAGVPSVAGAPGGGTPAQRIELLACELKAARWFDLVDLRSALNMTDPRIPDAKVLEAAAERITSTPPVHSAGVQEAIRSLLDEMDGCATAGVLASPHIVDALRALIGVPK
jgi:hypothetical protein